MFRYLLETPLELLTLGARAHAALNAEMMDEIVAAMERDAWTCRQCGVCLPEMMEIDHLDGHRVSGRSRIAPICRFCHDRKHLLWAASRGRLVPIHAPDLPYEHISQIAWVILVHAGRNGVDHGRLIYDLDARRKQAQVALGHGNLEAILEAVLAMADSRGREAANASADGLDRQIRLAPSALFGDPTDMQVWTRGGCRPVSGDWRKTASPDSFPGYDVFARVGKALRIQDRMSWSGAGEGGRVDESGSNQVPQGEDEIGDRGHVA